MRIKINDMKISRKVQLMTYPDSLGGNLKSLQQAVDTYLSDAIGGIHILPPYPSSADRGFAPKTHLEIDQRFGTWEDIESLATKYDLILDLICGHLSVESQEFQDYLKNGRKSEFADMFMRVDKVFPDGKIPMSSIAAYDYLTPIPPFIVFTLQDGTKEMHFRTFMPHQADLDPFNEKTQDLYKRFATKLARHGVKMVRLDAIETIAKEPEGLHMVDSTHQVIKELIKMNDELGMLALCEMHNTVEQKQWIESVGGWSYDFHMPERIIYALYEENATPLKQWLKKASYNQISVLTNHDGFMIGMEGESISPEISESVRKTMFRNAGPITERASGVGSNNISVHGINATLLEVFFRDQEKWLASHALHILCSKGIPQVYYNDLLAQRNDEEGYHQVGEGRALIRHNHTNELISHKFEQPFVQKVIAMMRIRNNFPAFQGVMEVLPSAKHIVKVLWSYEGSEAEIVISTKSCNIQVTLREPGQEEKVEKFG
jgi:sucrose phosphorylase